MAYPETDVVLLCFSVARSESMENITTKWLPELKRFIPNALIVLVGTQVDLRDNADNALRMQQQQQQQQQQQPQQPTSLSMDKQQATSKRYVTRREGEELRKRIRAFKYVECSALTQYNIREVFATCIEACVDAAEKENKSGSIANIQCCCCFQSLFSTFRNSIRRRFVNNSNNSNSSNSTSNGTEMISSQHQQFATASSSFKSK